MRDLILGLSVFAGLLWGLTSGRRALLVLCWICFMRPHDFSYGALNALPIFKLAVVMAVVSSLYHGQFKLKFPPILLLFLALMGWALLTCFFAYNTEIAWTYYMDYLVTFWFVSILVFAATNDLTTLKYMLWASAGSLGILAAKTGGILTLKGGGHITKQINGFVGDNNVFGLTVCLAIGSVMGLKSTLPEKKAYRIAFYATLAFMVMCIVYTKSRGAFLSLGVILFLGNLASKNPIRNTLILVSVVVLAYLVIPASYFDRLNTFKDIQSDTSAMSRVFFWHLSWAQALDHPLFGIGLDNFMSYNVLFYGSELGNADNHVAHSVYFQILAETGFPGLFLYLCICISTLVALIRVRSKALKAASRFPDLSWVAATSFWMRSAFIGYIFGSAFLNMLPYDFPWYFIWMSHMLEPLLNREVARRNRKINAAAPVPASRQAPAAAQAPAPRQVSPAPRQVSPAPRQVSERPRPLPPAA